MWVNQGRETHSVFKKWIFQHQGMLVRKHVAVVEIVPRTVTLQLQSGKMPKIVVHNVAGSVVRGRA